MVQRGVVGMRGRISKIVKIIQFLFLVGGVSSLHAIDYRGPSSSCKIQLADTARTSPLEQNDIQVLVPEMGFAAMNGGAHYVQPSASDEAMIHHFLRDFPNVSREALAADLALSQEVMENEGIGFHLNLRAFAQRNGVGIKNVLTNFLGLKTFIVEVANELHPSEISFGPKKSPVAVYQQDILEIFNLYNGKLPDDTAQILANAIYAGALDTNDLFGTLGFSQKYKISGIDVVKAVMLLRETISITKRVEGFARIDTEKVSPTYAEGLLLYEIINNVLVLNDSKKLRDKIKSLEEHPHRNDELDSFSDVIHLLSLEYGFTLRDPTL